MARETAVGQVSGYSFKRFNFSRGRIVSGGRWMVVRAGFGLFGVFEMSLVVRGFKRGMCL